MKKSLAEVTLTINDLAHDGRGIATLNGKTTFIEGGLAGETVQCSIYKKHSRYNEGIVTQVLAPSSQRAIPACKHFTICGGCSLQHLDAEQQVHLKQKILLEQLKHFGNVIPEDILPPISGKTLGYRRKARLGVRFVQKKGRVLIGFREKSSRFLADLEVCPVLHSSVGTKLTELSNLIASLSQFEHVPQIEVAASDQNTALVFRHLTDLPETDLEKIRGFAAIHGFHIYLQPNPPAPITKIWPKDSSPLLHYQLDEYQLTLQFHPLDFIQVNEEINHLMIKKALELLQPTTNEEVLDLFCGLGNFTLPLARFAKHVIGVEGDAAMIVRAKTNAELNQLNNVEFYTENLFAESTSLWRQKSYDKILLDPPRSGAKELLQSFTQLNAKKIVYVSCNPATLARDAGILVYTHKYKLKKAGVINMFPHTSHIETIALFEK